MSILTRLLFQQQYALLIISIINAKAYSTENPVDKPLNHTTSESESTEIEDALLMASDDDDGLQNNVTGGSKGTDRVKVTQILSHMLQNYDKKTRPNYGGGPDQVRIGIAVLNIGTISEKTMEFSLHCYFRQIWKDTRLSWQARNHTNLPLHAQTVLQEIWHPDTYIRNGKKSFTHKLTVPNILLRLGSDGTILLSQRLTIHARCLMRLSKFPMDRQECYLEIGSLGYNSDELQYSWTRTGVEVDLTQELSQFRLIKVITKSNQSVEATTANMMASIITAHFLLVREKGYYILQIYLPTSMIVAMSWVSFWINKEAAIARCSLGVTTVLTLTTLRLGVKEELPVVHYSTALDVFLFVAFGFVLGALVEFVIIHSAYLSLLRSMLDQTKKIDRRRNRAISFGLLDEKSPTTLRRIHSYAKNRLATVYRKTSASLYSFRYPVTFSTCDEFSSIQQRNISCGDIGSKLAAVSASSFSAVDEEDTGHEDHRPSVECNKENDEDNLEMKYASLDTGSIQYIDRYAKFLFPLCFLLFHIIYWTSYSYLIEDESHSMS